MSICALFGRVVSRWWRKACVGVIWLGMDSIACDGMLQCVMHGRRTRVG